MNLYFKWMVGSVNKTTQFALGLSTTFLQMIFTDKVFKVSIQR